MKIHCIFILAVCFAVFSCKEKAAITDFGAPTDHVHAGQEMRAYKNLAFKGWLVTAPDGGLIGISVEIYNLSKDTPLEMRSEPDCIPIGAVLADRVVNHKIHVGVGKILLRKNAQPSTSRNGAAQEIKWTMPPSSVKCYFIPIRSLVRKLPAEDRVGPCDLSIHMNAYPDWIGTTMFHPPFQPLDFVEVFITKQALEMDPVQALKKALAASGAVDETHFTMPQVDETK